VWYWARRHRSSRFAHHLRRQHHFPLKEKLKGSSQLGNRQKSKLTIKISLSLKKEGGLAEGHTQ
jgi:hypothetical protein